MVWVVGEHLFSLKALLYLNVQACICFVISVGCRFFMQSPAASGHCIGALLVYSAQMFVQISSDVIAKQSKMAADIRRDQCGQLENN